MTLKKYLLEKAYYSVEHMNDFSDGWGVDWLALGISVLLNIF